MRLTLKLLEELFPTEFMGRTAPKGYFWKVVFDPTRNDEEPGCFYGSLFRLLDILPTVDEVSPWPDGIMFEHTETGQHLTFIDGQPKYMDFPADGCRERRRRKPVSTCPSFRNIAAELSPISERVN